jgi:hypothetical protein
VSGNLQQVHVRVNDAGTGKPTPCRIRFTDAEGNCYAPYGRTTPAQDPEGCDTRRRAIAGYISDEETWSYVDGTCEIELPSGAVHVVIEKGPEYERLEQQVQLPVGKLALRFELHQLYDPCKEGWYAGAMTWTSLSPHEVLLEGAAEGLRVVDLLAYERETNRDGCEKWPVLRICPPSPREEVDTVLEPSTTVDYPNLLAFSGQRPCLETPECLVAVNTLNLSRSLGNVALLHCHRIVFPLRFGRSAFDGSAHHRPDNWTLADWCDQCHRKRGLVVGLSVHCSDEDPWYGGEALADLILGKVDAVGWRSIDPWYKLLSLGLRVPIVAKLPDRPLGYFERTYVQPPAGEPFSYGTWIEAIRAGRTSVGRGAFLSMTVNGRPPGSEVELPPGGGHVTLAVSAVSRELFDIVEIIQDGAVVHTAAAQHDVLVRASAEMTLPVAHSGWLAARCLREDADGGGWVYAHTSAVYLSVGGQPPPIDPQDVEEITECLDRTLAWVQRDADCPTPKDRERLANVFLEAKQVLARKLSSSGGE